MPFDLSARNIFAIVFNYVLSSLHPYYCQTFYWKYLCMTKKKLCSTRLFHILAFIARKIFQGTGNTTHEKHAYAYLLFKL